MRNRHLHLKKAFHAALLVLLLGVVGTTKMYAYNFSAVCETGQTLYYKIIDAENHYVALTYPSSIIFHFWMGYAEPTGDMVLPENVQCNGVTYFVTSIGDHAFESCSGLTSIEISNSVTSIGNSAFLECSGLTSIEIPNSVTSIGMSAFESCSGLTSIEIPNSVTSIEHGAFWFCISLTTIEIPNSVTSIGSWAFCDCFALTTIEIPNSVTSIGDDTFFGCESLTTIEIPNSVTSIGNYAFSGCESLTTIEIPNSVTSIGNYAFSGCESLTSIEIPNSITSIPHGAFSGCNGLTGSLIIPNSVISIGNSAFYSCSGLTSIEIPNSVTSIGNSAFSGSRGLTGSLIIPNSVTSIGNSAFSGCRGLEQIVVDSGNMFYDSRDNCNAIIETSSNEMIAGCKNTVIPNSVTLIGDYVFYDCLALTTIEIPNSVTSIGSSAFYGCSGLTSMTVLAANPPTLGSNAFYNVNMEISVNVLCGSVEAYTAANWGGFSNFIGFCGGTVSVAANPEEGGMVSGGGIVGADEICTVTATANEGYAFFFWTQNETMVSIDAEYSFYVTSDMELVAYFVSEVNITFADANVKSLCVANWDTNSDGELSYAEAAAVTDLGTVFKNNSNIISFVELQYFTGLTSIGSSAFYGCSGLTTIEIPSSVTSIGNSAFYGCSGLTTIEIPNSVTSIGSSAFKNCSSLTTIEIPSSVTSIGNLAFSGCSGLTTIEIPNSVTSISSSAFSGCSSLTTIEIPNSVTSIGSGAFEYCSGLTTIEIPNSVTSIGSGAFEYCSGLTTIEIPNSVTSIGSSAFSGCRSLTTIEISNSVASIGFNAFYNCSGLTTIEIPSSVTSIGSSAFFGCSSLTSIEIPNSVTTIGRWAFYRCSGLEQIVVDSGNTIYDSRDNCNALIETSTNELVAGCKNTVIPNSVTSICESAFYSCSGLTTIQIPNSVTTIGDNAFLYCSGLTTIEISNSVTSIGSWAFCNCSGLTSMIVLADNPPTLDNTYVFSGVNKSIPVYVPCESVEAYTTINWGGFNHFIGICGGTVSVAANPVEGGMVSGGGIVGADENCTVTATANEGYSFAFWTKNGTWVSANAEYTFYVTSDMNLVAYFVLNGNITFVDANVKALCVANWDTDGDGELSYAEAAAVTNLGTVFKNNSNITAFDELQYFVRLTSIDNSAFSGCNGLTTIEIPNTVTSIGYNVFYGCSGLTTIEIPNTVTSISTYAFYNCIGLTSMTVLAENPPTLGGNFVFFNINKSIPVYVPCSSLEAYQNASGWSAFTNIQELCTQSQTITLSEGWNWFSSNVDITLNDLKAALVAAVPGTSITIKSQSNGSTSYNGSTWRGALTTLDVSQMYMISVGADCEITLTGIPINPAEHPVTISHGVNWIAFPFNQSMTLSEAFAGFAVSGDKVKSQTTTGNYNGSLWRPSFSLVPGKGYMYISNTPGTRTFIFPASAK